VALVLSMLFFGATDGLERAKCRLYARGKPGQGQRARESGQVTLRRVDGWDTQHVTPADESLDLAA
jgi:hypothetical protein